MQLSPRRAPSLAWCLVFFAELCVIVKEQVGITSQSSLDNAIGQINFGPRSFVFAHTLLFPTDEIYADTKLEYHWAATEGDDIWMVHLDSEGKVIPPEADNLLTPKLKGSDFIWRPNDKDMNRAIIGVFDEAYDLLAAYYLEITEENGEDYAEVVKIDDEIPPILG